jgi:CelD/BcsL family acetyltransferase involved in cellulose biosynthesis
MQVQQAQAVVHPTGRQAQAEAALLDLRLPIGPVTLEAHRSLCSAEREWRAFESGAAGHPYQQFHWLAAWDEHIRPADALPFVILLRHGGRVRMLLPLVIERSLGLSRLVPMGAPVCDYHAPLIEPGFADQLTPQITQTILREITALAGVDYLLLTHVPPMVGRARNPFSALPMQAFSSNGHGAVLGSDWQTYYASRRGGKTRSRLRRKEKSLAQLGPIAFRPVTDPDQRAALAAELLALKAAHLRETAGAFNTLARSDVQAFFRELASDGAREDVFFFELTAGGNLVAAAMGVVRDGCFYYQLSAYPDNAAQRYSPGALLLNRLMEWAIGRGCTRFDFTVGDEAYKTDWCDDTWGLRCGAWPRTMRGRIGALLAIAAIVLTGHVKRHRRLSWLAVRCRTAVGKLRHALVAAPA